MQVTTEDKRETDTWQQTCQPGSVFMSVCWHLKISTSVVHHYVWCVLKHAGSFPVSWDIFTMKLLVIFHNIVVSTSVPVVVLKLLWCWKLPAFSPVPHLQFSGLWLFLSSALVPIFPQECPRGWDTWMPGSARPAAPPPASHHCIDWAGGTPGQCCLFSGQIWQQSDKVPLDGHRWRKSNLDTKSRGVYFNHASLQICHLLKKKKASSHKGAKLSGIVGSGIVTCQW